MFKDYNMGKLLPMDFSDLIPEYHASRVINEMHDSMLINKNGIRAKKFHGTLLFRRYKNRGKLLVGLSSENWMSKNY